MALKCIFRFEALDSTKCLNKRAEYLFKKGVYWGGVVTTDSEQVTNIIYVSPFRLISHDGMYVLSDTSIPIVVGTEGTYYVVCKAKYVIDDSPDISVMLMSVDTFNSLTEDEKLEYIIFADVTSDGYGVQINMTVNREEISQLGRNPWRGYFTSEEELESIQAMVGDVAMVKTNSTIGAELYVFNGVNWVRYGSATDIYEKLVNHQNNNDTSLAHNIPSVGEEDVFNGSLHINFNQLNSLKQLDSFRTDEENHENAKSHGSKTVNTNGKVQVVYIDFKEFRNNVDGWTYDESVTIAGFNEKQSVAELTTNSYYVDKDNGIVYLLGTNGSSATISYESSYKNREVVIENEATRLPRNNELSAIKGNEYSLYNEDKQVPSNSNRFITSNTPIPEIKEVVIPSNQIIEGKYIRLNTGMTVFLRNVDNAIEYFEVVNLENNIPTYCYSLHVVDNNVRRNLSNNDLTNGWFTTSSNKNIDIEIKGYADFVNSTISGSVVLRYYGPKSLGSKDVKSFADEIEEPKFRRFHTVKVNTLFSIDNNGYSSSVSDGKVVFKKDTTEFGKLYSSVINNKNTLNVFGDRVLDLSTDRSVVDGTVKVSSNLIEIGDSETDRIDLLSDVINSSANTTKIGVTGANNKYIELDTNTLFATHPLVRVNSTNTELNSTEILKLNNSSDTTIASGNINAGNGHGTVNLYGANGSEINLSSSASVMKNDKGNAGYSRVTASSTSIHNANRKRYSIVDAITGRYSSYTRLKTYDNTYMDDYSSVEVNNTTSNNNDDLETYSVDIHSVVTNNNRESIVKITNESYSTKNDELAGIYIKALQNPILNAQNNNIKYSIAILSSIGNSGVGDSGIIIASNTSDDLSSPASYVKLNNKNIRLSSDELVVEDTDVVNILSNTRTNIHSTGTISIKSDESYTPSIVLESQKAWIGLAYNDNIHKNGLTCTLEKTSINVKNRQELILGEYNTANDCIVIANHHDNINQFINMGEQNNIVITNTYNTSYNASIGLGYNSTLTNNVFNVDITNSNGVTTLPIINISGVNSVTNEDNILSMNSESVLLQSKLKGTDNSVREMSIVLKGGISRASNFDNVTYTIHDVTSTTSPATQIDITTTKALQVKYDGATYYIPLIFVS